MGESTLFMRVKIYDSIININNLVLVKLVALRNPIITNEMIEREREREINKWATHTDILIFLQNIS